MSDVICLVIGFGSIGQRHARLLSCAGHRVAVVSRRRDAECPWPIFASVAEALDALSPNLVVVATETSDHARVLADVNGRLSESCHILIEKPLFLPGEAYRSAADTYVAYNMRFHPVIQALRSALSGERIVSVEMRCGSYLPDWRPNRDYRQTASALKAAGGGVLLDLSHELDFANWLFGRWERLSAIVGRFSPLEIETPDTALLLVETACCPAMMITLNYTQRAAQRDILVTTDRETFVADLEAGTLTAQSNGTTQHFDVDIDATYTAEHAAALAGDATTLCTFEQAMMVQTMLEAVERSVAEGAWIKNE